MSFTTYKILAFIGGFAGTVIVAALGYLEGRRAHRKELARICQARADDNQMWRLRLQRAEHEHSLSRLNAAQAIEAMTEESDERIKELAKLRLMTNNALAEVRKASAIALTEADTEQLISIAAKLNLAAQTFAGIGARDQATACRTLAAAAVGLFERYWAAQQPLTQEQVA